MLRTRNKALRQIAGFAETFNWLFLRLLLSRRPGARVYSGRVYREYLRLGGSGPWRAERFFNVFPELRERSARITLDHKPGRGISTPVDELAYLALATRAIDPERIFEFGTFRGRTALNFALNSDDKCEVFTLDLGEGQEEASAGDAAGLADRVLMERRSVGEAYRGSEVESRIHQLFGNSLEFDFSPFAQKVDLVFVDGGHSYEVARSDTENALRMCRPGGAILWHDFGNYGDYHDVVRAVLDVIPGDRVVQIENSQLAVYRVPT